MMNALQIYAGIIVLSLPLGASVPSAHAAVPKIFSSAFARLLYKESGEYRALIARVLGHNGTRLSEGEYNAFLKKLDQPESRALAEDLAPRLEQAQTALAARPGAGIRQLSAEHLSFRVNEKGTIQFAKAPRVPDYSGARQAFLGVDPVEEAFTVKYMGSRRGRPYLARTEVPPAEELARLKALAAASSLAAVKADFELIRSTFETREIADIVLVLESAQTRGMSAAALMNDLLTLRQAVTIRVPYSRANMDGTMIIVPPLRDTLDLHAFSLSRGLSVEELANLIGLSLRSLNLTDFTLLSEIFKAAPSELSLQEFVRRTSAIHGGVKIPVPYSRRNTNGYVLLQPTVRESFELALVAQQRATPWLEFMADLDSTITKLEIFDSAQLAEVFKAAPTDVPLQTFVDGLVSIRKDFVIKHRVVHRGVPETHIEQPSLKQAAELWNMAHSKNVSLQSLWDDFSYVSVVQGSKFTRMEAVIAEMKTFLY